MSSTSTEIAEGDRIYATEAIDYPGHYQDGYQDRRITPADEGTVVALTGQDDWDLYVEWDAGFGGAVSSATVALVPPLAR